MSSCVIYIYHSQDEWDEIQASHPKTGLHLHLILKIKSQNHDGAADVGLNSCYIDGMVYSTKV